VTRKQRWIFGGIGLAVLASGVAATELVPRYQLGQLSFPWQQSRRRLFAAREMFSPAPGQRGPLSMSWKFRKDLTPEEQAELHRKQREQNRQTCAALAKAWADYVVRCAGPEAAEREAIRAEMLQSAASELRERVAACDEGGGDPVEGPPAEEQAPCLQFFASGSCDILDYDPKDLTLSTLDVMVTRPSKPQPHMLACPFIFH
jgi:hypothetical protein